MKTSVMKAIALILSADAELLDILSVTAEMSLQSSLIALLLGVAGFFMDMRLLPAVFTVDMGLNFRQHTCQIILFVKAAIDMRMQHKVGDTALRLAVFIKTFTCMFMDA